MVELGYPWFDQCSLFVVVRRFGVGLSFDSSLTALRFFFHPTVLDEGLGRFVFIRQARDCRLVLALPLEVGIFAMRLGNGNLVKISH